MALYWVILQSICIRMCCQNQSGKMADSGGSIMGVNLHA